MLPLIVYDIYVWIWGPQLVSCDERSELDLAPIFILIWPPKNHTYSYACRDLCFSTDGAKLSTLDVTSLDVSPPILCPSNRPLHIAWLSHRPTKIMFKHDATMATSRAITRSSITSPTDGRSPSNLLQPLPRIDPHKPMRRQLQCHSYFHVRSRRPSRAREFTISTSRDLVQFAVTPSHHRFEWNHFPSLSNSSGKQLICFS